MKVTAASLLVLAAIGLSFAHLSNAEEEGTKASLQLVELRMERDKNAIAFGPNHPTVKSLDAEIAAAEARVKNATNSEVAKDFVKAPAHSMKGTYLITFGSGADNMKALVDPSVVTLGDRQFISGTVSGRVGDILEDTIFSGRTAYVALDSVVTIQEIQQRQN